MISKSDIKSALQSKPINSFKDNWAAFATFVLLCIKEYYMRTGMNAIDNKSFIEETARYLCTDLRKHFGHLAHEELKLALECGSNGVFGDVKHPCDATFKLYLKKYLELSIRELAKQDLKAEKNKNLKLLDFPQDGIGYDHVEAMRKRWRLNKQLVITGNSIRDEGGLLYDYLKEIGFCEITEEQKQRVVERLKEQSKNTMKFVYFKKLSQGLVDEIELMSFFRAECLKEYFLMEIEADKIKKEQNG